MRSAWAIADQIASADRKDIAVSPHFTLPVKNEIELLLIRPMPMPSNGRAGRDFCVINKIARACKITRCSNATGKHIPFSAVGAFSIERQFEQIAAIKCLWETIRGRHDDLLKPHRFVFVLSSYVPGCQAEGKIVAVTAIWF